MKESVESSLQSVLSEGSKTLTVGTSDQSCLHSNTKMVFVFFHCVDITLGIETMEDKTAGRHLGMNDSSAPNCHAHTV